MPSSRIFRILAAVAIASLLACPALAQQSSFPNMPNGSKLRQSVQSSLKSSCANSCNMVYNSQIRICDTTPSPSACQTQVQKTYKLCQMQCN